MNPAAALANWLAQYIDPALAGLAGTAMFLAMIPAAAALVIVALHLTGRI